MALLPPLPPKYKGRFFIAAIALVLFAAAAVFGDHGLAHLLHMRHDQRALEDMTFNLQQHNEHLRQRIQRLESDDHYIEQLARERLGMVKKGELIYRIAPPTPHAPGR